MKSFIIGVITLLSLFLTNSQTLAASSANFTWDPGTEDCKTTTQSPLQVHKYNEQTFILRENLCINYEGNFMYLLLGKDKAMLIDTGAVADPKMIPLVKAVNDLLPDKSFPLLIVHTHGHHDHYAGDAQFVSRPNTQIVAPDLNKMQQFFRFRNWPNDNAQLDLGNRVIDVIPAPGHLEDHVVFYDKQTGIFFSGDFLMPGRLLIQDQTAYYKSAVRVANFFKTHPVNYILGGHVELDASGNAYNDGATYHPHEHQLALSKSDLMELPHAFETFNGFYSVHPNYVLSNPMHNLIALIVGILLILSIIIWGIRRWYQRSHKKK